MISRGWAGAGFARIGQKWEQALRSKLTARLVIECLSDEEGGDHDGTTLSTLICHKENLTRELEPVDKQLLVHMCGDEVLGIG